MTYHDIAYIHLSTIFPAVLIATFLLLMEKGTALHRTLGKIYMVLMLFTAAITLLMPAAVGPRLFNHFGFIHLFSLLVLHHVPTAFIAVRRGDIKTHKSTLTGLYIGTLIAGVFTLVPGRLLHSWLF